MKKIVNTNQNKFMKIVAISDTHGSHWDVKVPEADCLIHCGDFSSQGRLPDTLDFLRWFNTHPHKHNTHNTHTRNATPTHLL